jgi:hypothetical protein
VYRKQDFETVFMRLNVESCLLQRAKLSVFFGTPFELALPLHRFTGGTLLRRS